MSEAITVADWSTAPEDSEMANLAGSILNVMVSGTVGPDPAPLGGFFRFARVIRVNRTSEVCGACARCGGQARWQITVQWEAGYVSPDGDVLCESCVAGLVTGGAHLIAFGEDQPGSAVDLQSVKVTFNLRTTN